MAVAAESPPVPQAGREPRHFRPLLLEPEQRQARKWSRRARRRPAQLALALALALALLPRRMMKTQPLACPPGLWRPRWQGASGAGGAALTCQEWEPETRPPRAWAAEHDIAAQSDVTAQRHVTLHGFPAAECSSDSGTWGASNTIFSTIHPRPSIHEIGPLQQISSLWALEKIPHPKRPVLQSPESLRPALVESACPIH